MHNLTILMGLILVALGIKIFLNKVKVDPYEYLEILSFTKWKKARKVRNEMQTIKNGRISHLSFFNAMALLEDEGYIKRKVIDMGPFKVYWYKRIPTSKKQPEKRFETPIESTPVLSPA